MLHLHFAPNADLLVPQLANSLRSVWNDPLYSPTVVVPHPVIGTWLKLRLTDSIGGFGCVANISMPVLEHFLWNALRPGDANLLDADTLSRLLCELLDEELLQGALYEPVQSYLMANGCGIDHVKRVQLCVHIARLFLEYEYNRPGVWDAAQRRWREMGIVECWLSDNRYAPSGRRMDDEFTSAEAWQADLYRRAMAAIAAAKNPLNNLVSLPGLYRRRCEAGQPMTLDKNYIALFQIAKISRFHRNMLVELSKIPNVEMDVFLTNPCAEFWEDVASRRRISAVRSSREHGGSAGTCCTTTTPRSESSPPSVLSDHRLLELWGRSGRENISLWCAATEWDFTYYSPDWAKTDAAPCSVLRALQLSLLRRWSSLGLPPNAPFWSTDSSLQVLASADPGREIEAIRDLIFDSIEEGIVERLNDVAIYLADMATYLPYIHRVFGATAPGQPGHIPYRVIGATAGDSVFAQAVNVLLDIIEGRFDRAHVFTLLRNPLVQSSLGLAAEDVAVWERWAEEVGAIRGFNREHRRLIGDRGAALTDAHTFELGMARLLIGNLTAEPAVCPFLTIDGESDVDGSIIIPYRDFDSSDADLVEGFCGTIERLYEDVMNVIAAVRSDGVEGAAVAFSSVVGVWLGGMIEGRIGDAVEESRIRHNFLKALQQLTLSWRRRTDRDASVEECIVWIRRCLPEELSPSSRAWTEGITVAPLRQAMVVPHKVIFTAGMNAAVFPGGAERPSWDLLAYRRERGDPDPVDDNRYAFLELIHAAQQRLVVSYRCFDLQREEELQPSSVVLELESFMEAAWLSASADRLGCHPKERFSLRCKIPLFAHEAAELSAEDSFRCWDPVQTRLTHLIAEKRVRLRYDPCQSSSPVSGSTGQTLRTSIYAIQRFFSNPLEYHLAQTLGIDLEEPPSVVGVTDEPAESPPLAMARIKRNIMAEVLQRVFPRQASGRHVDDDSLKSEAATFALRNYWAHRAGGDSPEAYQARMEIQALIRWAQKAAETACKLSNTFSAHYLLQNAALSLNRSGLGDELDLLLRNNHHCIVECRHRLVLVPRSWSSCDRQVGIIVIGKGEKSSFIDYGLWLEGVVQWLAERKLADPTTAASITLVHIDRDLLSISTRRLSDDQPKTALVRIEGWLGGLIAEMLIDKRTEHLPFAVIRDMVKPPADNSTGWDAQWESIRGAEIQERLDSEYSPYICYLEAFQLVEARIPPLADNLLRSIARQRFAPLIEGWLDG